MAELEATAPMSRIESILADNGRVEIEELDKSGNVQRRWIHHAKGQLVQVHNANHSAGFFSRSLREWKRVISDAFLPVGFPHSVSADYLAYQTFDSLQAFFSTISSLLASRALLEGLGVGNASSSATFALLLTIMKDAMSRVATIVFAHRFGLRIEPDAKKYRFLADLFNDSAFFLELYSPYLSSWGKVAALSVGEALRALCGVAAGASKAALSVHFAKHDNLAELNAKEASQETAVGLVGLLVGTVVVKAVEDHTSVVYLMILLVLAHLWMNYLGVRCVTMSTLNRQRATLLFQEYLRSNKTLTPKAVAEKESILLWSPLVTNQDGTVVAKVEMAQSYGEAVGNGAYPVDIVDDEHHLIFICDRPAGQPRSIRILLRSEADARDALGAWFKAVEIAWNMMPETGFDEKLREIFHTNEAVAGYERRFSKATLWVKLQSSGWDLGTQSLETGAPVRLKIQAVKKDM